ncbi:hypothetical protein AJ80_10010 [Polytolypa hystricis UAMH7299]|uniref:Uncharacterized protein n=1 Tax=Polytolypa hystricis (strain UAMH7299) TaxID=1447883 RepID=A0A2B7WF28_POLH7|nr:hypothetical protein AJ80_10010 [Polytolypa hystricis UAMH7299]
MDELYRHGVLGTIIPHAILRWDLEEALSSSIQEGPDSSSLLSAIQQRMFFFGTPTISDREDEVMFL